MDQNLPKRKELRLKQYDYSSTGTYFVTICVKDRKPILSSITKPVGVGAFDDPQSDTMKPVGVGAFDDPQSDAIKPVGVGAFDDPQSDAIKPVGVGAFDDPQVQLTQLGKIVEKNLLSSENISGVKIDKYVIMPDHIHAIVFLDSSKYAGGTDGSSRAPTPTNEMLPRVISAFKRFCRKDIGDGIFQRGYMEHIIRDGDDYETRLKYIHENPIRRYYSDLLPEK